MGNLVFQATLGGQVNLVGPNTASTFNLNVPAVSSTLATLTGTETFTNKTLTSPTLTTPILGTPASGTLTNCTGLPNAGLVNSSVTVGSTAIALGATATTVAGLTSLATNTLTSAASTALTLQSAGTTALTVTTAQNVGIGTTTPTDDGGYGKIVDIYGSTGGALYLHTSTATNYAFLGKYNSSTQLADSGSAGLTFATASGSTPVERMRIDSSGNVGIGTSSPSYKLHVNGNIVSTSAVQFSDASGVITFAGASCAVAVDYGGAGVDTGFITKSRATSGTSEVFSIRNNSNTVVGLISHNNTNTTYATSSDYRLKENIAPMTGALNIVAQLKPVTYTWKSNGSSSQGFIAHELQAVIPDAVVGEKDGVDANGNIKPQGIDTSFLVATLTAALQETKALIDTQAETLTQQTEAINALTARVVALEAK